MSDATDKDGALWKLGAAMARVLEHIEDLDGELTPELEAELDALASGFDDKVLQCGFALRNLAVEEAAIDIEIKRLQDRKRRRSKAQERLKAYMAREMARTGRTSVDAPLLRVRLHRNSRPAVEFFGDPKTLPPGLQKVTVAVDKEAAYQLWKQGHPFPPEEGWEITLEKHIRVE